MPTEPTNATKSSKGKQPGPALREARRLADEAVRRADELQRRLDEALRRGPTTPPTDPTTPPTTPTEPTSASDDPLDEPPPPKPQPSTAETSSSEPSDGDDEREPAADEKPTTSPVSEDAVRGMLSALLGQAGEVNRYLALKLLKTGAAKKAQRAGADAATAEELAKAFLTSIGPQVRRIAEFSPQEKEALIRVLTPRAQEALEGSDKDTILWVTIIGIYAGKVVQLTELVDFGAEVSDAVAEPQHKVVEVDVSPTKEPT